MNVRHAIRAYLTHWLDFYRPTTRDATWVLGGFVLIVLGLVALAVGFDAIQGWLGTAADPASHRTTTELKRATADGGVSQRQLLGTLAALWLAAVVEEFAVRQHAQKLVALLTGWPVAIGLTSIGFALIHVPAYGGLPVTIGLIESLSAIFLVSVALGTVYWRTGNILAAMALHGCWNTFVLAFVVFGI